MTSLEERMSVDACVWGHFYDDKLSSVTTCKEVAEAWKRVFGDEVQPLISARAAIAVCAEEMARRIEEGFDKPVCKPYRTDGVPSKNDQCPHGAYMYESCDACCAAAIRSMGERGC